MKNLKIVIAAFALFAAIGTQAQELKKATPAQRASIKAGKESVDAELKLTPDQKTKMDAIRKKYMEKTRDIKANEREERRKQVLALYDERDAEIKGVLTEEQYKKFVEFREKRRAEMKDRMQERMEERKKEKEKVD